MANVGNDHALGIELNGQLTINKWWNLNVNGNIYYYKVVNDIQSGGKKETSTNYDITLNNMFRVFKNTRIQLDGNFVGPSVTTQGRSDAFWFVNLAIRQQLFSPNLQSTLSFRDIFNSARYRSDITTADLQSITRIRPDYPVITLSISYTFNNFKRGSQNSRDNRDLFEGTNHAITIDILKGAMRKFAFDTPGILKLELSGQVILDFLLDHFVPAVLGQSQRYAAHFAIDAGADLILGHHTHILKPMEIYHGKAIVYSMANFALEEPGRFFEGEGNLTESKSHQDIAALNTDMKKSKRQMPTDSYKSLYVKVVIGDKRIKKVSFVPVQLDQGAVPHVLTPEDSRFGEIVEYMRSITVDQSLKTAYTVEGGEVLLLKDEIG